MKHSQEEIINALKVIQDTCCETSCKNCPFYNADDCVMQEQAPEEWKIKPSSPMWRAFE